MAFGWGVEGIHPSWPWEARGMGDPTPRSFWEALGSERSWKQDSSCNSAEIRWQGAFQGDSIGYISLRLSLVSLSPWECSTDSCGIPVLFAPSQKPSQLLWLGGSQVAGRRVRWRGWRIRPSRCLHASWGHFWGTRLGVGHCWSSSWIGRRGWLAVRRTVGSTADIWPWLVWSPAWREGRWWGSWYCCSIPAR